MLFIYFFLSWLISLTRTCMYVLNMSSKNEDKCFLSNLREKAFNLSLLSKMLTVGLPHMAFIMLSYFLSVPNFVRFLAWNNIVFCQVLFLDLLKRLWLIFNSTNAMFYTYWFAYVEFLLHPSKESHLIMVCNFLDLLLNSVHYYFKIKV